MAAKMSASNLFGFWIAVGIAVGAGVGVALHNIAMGVALGVAFGVAIGAIARHKAGKGRNDSA